MNIAMVKSYSTQNGDLFGWRGANDNDVLKPWKPEFLTHEQWPPNYKAVYAWRLQQLHKLRSNPALLASAKAYYRTRPKEFVMHWMDTYDPRRKGSKWIPFVFFKRQAEFFDFLDECVRDSENGLTEKCRDMGATWGCCGYSVHSWLFIPNDAIGWGSRKQELVDKKGDPSSIFEKMRLLIRRLPDIWKPKGLNERLHMSEMKILNPENGSVIAGEIGDSIGRGGRTRIYFKDESAHYVHPEMVQAALDDNTNVQIDISSVNGLGNVFHRRREAGIDWHPNAINLKPGYTRVFIYSYSDHPEKTPAWYAQRKAKAEREGLQHLFAQEIDRNYSAAISNTIIPYEWITAAVDAHLKIKWQAKDGSIQVGIPDYLLADVWTAALDVADGGIDRNAFAKRQGIIWRHVEEWGERDPGVTMRRAAIACRGHQFIKVQYDEIGIGSSVKSEYNRLVDVFNSGDHASGLDPLKTSFVGWNAGAAVVDPYLHIVPDDEQSALNKDFFQNFKAQAWWSLRTRFYKTFKNVTDGVLYPIDDLISLDGNMPLLKQLIKELAQPTHGPGASLRMVVDKKPDGTKSPNLADAGVMMYFPVRDNFAPLVGRYGM